MFTADAHCDTLYSLAIEKKGLGECTVSKARLSSGGVGLQVFALFSGRRDVCVPYPAVRAMLSCVPMLGVPMLKTLPETPPVVPSGILSLEGGEALEGKLDRLYELFAEGVRMIALTWNYENEIGTPALSDPDAGLKPFGRALIPEMDALGILTDVSHLNEAGFWEVAERTKLPIVASHSNLRDLCDTPRNLWASQARAIIRSKGFIGINFYTHFLTGTDRAELDDVIRHIDAIAELGGIDALGFGSDFDGIETWPEGLFSPADFPALIDRLLKSGYTRAQVEGIAGGNLWRVFKAAEKARINKNSLNLS